MRLFFQVRSEPLWACRGKSVNPSVDVVLDVERG